MSTYKATSEINKSDNFKLGENAYIRTCALILYDEDKGYLLCEELRKVFPGNNKKLYTHMIAGKVEMTDVIPFDTAIREFCEEFPFRLKDRDNNIFSIEDTVKKMKHDFKVCEKQYIDFPANSKKTLYNRFYIVNISDLGIDSNVGVQLYQSIFNWRSLYSSGLKNDDVESLTTEVANVSISNNTQANETLKTSLSDVFWWGGDELKTESTEMLNLFIANIPEQTLRRENFYV